MNAINHQRIIVLDFIPVMEEYDIEMIIWKEEGEEGKYALTATGESLGTNIVDWLNDPRVMSKKAFIIKVYPGKGKGV